MTLSMDLPENDDVQLSEENFRNVCRLCLHADEDFVNVFERIDQNPSKRPLAGRVYDLYQIKVSAEQPPERELLEIFMVCDFISVNDR